MSYLDESRLSAYDSKLKEWVSSQNSKTITPSIYPWTKTAKASTVSCYPVGGTELKPVVDFIFTETPPASGDKGPTNPSTISGISSVTVTLCETAGVDSTDYTVILGSTYYGGNIDLATGVMTVTHRYEQLTGSNADLSFSQTIGTCKRYSFTTIDSVGIEPAASYTNQQVCTHFNYFANWTLDEPHFYVTTQSSGIAYLYTTISSVATLNEWFASQYQAGTPVEFVYLLATPFTVQLTPTQILSLVQTDKYTPRLNTIYTDASAVQVGYVKSPIREEFELQQAIVVQGGNI